MMLLLPSTNGAILDEVGVVAYPAGVGFDFLDQADIFKFGKMPAEILHSDTKVKRKLYWHVDDMVNILKWNFWTTLKNSGQY